MGSIGAVRGIAIDPSNNNIIYAGVETNGIFKSTDAGNNWTFLQNSPQYAIARDLITDPVRPNTVYAGANQVFQSSDGGDSWTSISNGLPNTRVFSLYIPANNPNVIYASTGVGLYIYGLQPYNHTPVIGAFSAPTEPVAINTAVNISATFTDADINDTHTAIWDWGDNTTSNGTVTESNGSGTVSGTHTYTTAGVYTVGLTVTDNHNASANATYQYIVVYDPSAGFLTVGGNYNSQAGWDLQDANASGKVILGISAKYNQGDTIPTGSTKVMFNLGNIDFTSTSYQWMVVNGATAYLMGNGTVNGSGDYQIFVSAVDGSQTGGQNLIRVQLRDNSTQNIIYDTQPGDSTIANPTTVLSAGSIKIH